MVKVGPIAGGTDSDPLLCDNGHGFGPSNPVAVINHEGNVFCETCGRGEGPWIGDVWIGDHLPGHPAVARGVIQKTAEEEHPKIYHRKEKQQTQISAKASLGRIALKAESYEFSIRKRADEKTRTSKNHLLNGHL